MINFIDCGKSEFIDRTKNKNVYCFGAGKYLNEFIAGNYDVHISGIIDNYQYAQKPSINMNNTQVKVISLDDFLKIYDKKCVIIITCLSFDEIIQQLDSIEKLNGMDCYIEYFIKNHTEETCVNIDYTAKKQLIPKKIHYCWFGQNEIPDEYQRCIESWKKFCPDYEIIRWDETNYDVHKNLYVHQAYEHKQWAFVTDYARVDILYHEGGLYFDTDVELIRSFDNLLTWRMFCGFESNEYVAWGLGFGSVKEEPLLQDVLNVYNHITFINSDKSFNTTTCPIIQSNVLEKYGFKMNGQFQEKDNIAIYPKEYFAPISYIRGFGGITDNTYSIHHYSASWTNSNHKAHRLDLEKKIETVRNRKAPSLVSSSDAAVKNKFQIWECIGSTNTAGGKAPADIKNILLQLGYYAVNIHPYKGEKGSADWNWSQRRLEQEWNHCFEIIPERSILFLQYPFCQEQDIRNSILLRLKTEKNVRIFVFIHDVEALRKIFLDKSKEEDFHFILQLADIFIVHNTKMLTYFTELGVSSNRLIPLRIFDYLLKKQEKNIIFERSITIAGNLQTVKSPYIGKLSCLAPLKVHLYGPNYENQKAARNINYHGSYSSDEIPQILNRGFGLVWDGDSLDGCFGDTGEYLRYNNPHKLSLYLASGIPVIIWEHAAEASFVKENNVGITVNSLYEVSTILAEMNENIYKEYLHHVKIVSEKIIHGYYTKNSLKKAETIIFSQQNIS